MAASGYTPISLYYSTTASAVPTAGNLANGELALNIADMKLYAKNSSGVVTLLASNASTTGVDSLSFGSTGLTPSTATTGAITVAGTLNVANGGTGVTTSTGTGSVVLSNSPTLVTPALGTPSSGVVTNLTGTASININGTVGATTPTTGAFTTLSASSTVTLSGGTANGVTYLNGSKVLTSGSALQFDGFNLGVYTAPSAWASGGRINVPDAGALISQGTALDIGTNWYYNGGFKYATTTTATWYQQTGGAHKWYSAASGTAGDPITFTQVFGINASGAIGVGSSPSYGTSGQVLTSAGSGAAPIWSTPTGVTTGKSIAMAMIFGF